MKKFSRCVLILIIVAILSSAAGYVYEKKKSNKLKNLKKSNAKSTTTRSLARATNADCNTLSTELTGRSL